MQRLNGNNTPMEARFSEWLKQIGWMACCLAVPASLPAQTQPRFIDIRPLTNKEVRLQLNAPAGRGYRIDASTNLPSWTPMVTLTGATATLLHTDTAAPFLGTRYYRAEQLSITNLLTGDQERISQVEERGHYTVTPTAKLISI